MRPLLHPSSLILVAASLAATAAHAFQPVAYGYPYYAPAAYAAAPPAPAYGYRYAPRPAPYRRAPQPAASRPAPAPVAAAPAPSRSRPDPAPAASLKPEPRRQALGDLLALLDYPLESDAQIPRVEIPHLPEQFLSMEDTGKRKALFVRMLLPLVLMENEALARRRERMLAGLDTVEAGRPLKGADREWLRALAREYRVDGDPVDSSSAREALRRKVDVLAPSLALAQAANESAWGRSRFAREGANLFGIWTYDESKGIVPKKRAPGKKHLVRRFDTLRDSVRYYLHTLNSHPAYVELRQIRAAQRARGKDPAGSRLAAGLERYSARGEEYIALIREIIARHDLERLDDIRLAG